VRLFIYFEKREATATDILLFRHWCDLATKRKEAQKQPIDINTF
jgi:hypothetical protein